MKILMLSWEFPPRVVGGLGRHVYDLSTALAAKGHEVHVVTCGDGASKAFEVVEGVNVIRTDAAALPGQDFVTWVMNLNFSLVEKAANLVLKQGRFDLIHAHDWLVAFAAETVKKAYHWPLVSTIHATEWGRNHGLHTDLQRYISSVEWRLAYESWRVICCSRYMYGELKGIFGLPDDKLSIIPNGVKADEFMRKRGGSLTDNEFRLRWAARDEKIIFYIGRLVHEKGVSVLLEAIPRVLNQYNGAKFIIAGTGPEYEALRGRARDLGIDHRLYFPGFVDDDTRIRLLQSADISVIPSLYEPFGIVALEAMAAGSPVVVSDVGGLGEIIIDGVNGLKFGVGNSEQLSGVLLEILRKPELAARLAKRGREDTLTTYNWENISQQTEDVYTGVLLEASKTEWANMFNRYFNDSPPRRRITDFVTNQLFTTSEEVFN